MKFHPFRQLPLSKAGQIYWQRSISLGARASRARLHPWRCWGLRIAIPEDALRYFAGKRVRIFQHDDEAGRDAGALWAAQLIAAGVEVDGYSFGGLTRADGSAVKDLNDFAHVHPDQWEEQREIIEEAFSFAQEGPPRASDGAADKRVPDRAKGGIAGLWQGFSNIRRTGRRPEADLRAERADCKASDRERKKRI